MNAQAILRALQLPNGSTVNSIYLVGSRLWGTETPKSDFDILVVVEAPSSHATLQKSQHKGNYDMTVVTETQFRAQVEAGSLIETVCCLLDPDSDTVLHPVPEKGAPLNKERRKLVSLEAMRAWIDERARRDLEKAEKFWVKGSSSRENGWKILHHSLAAECIMGGLLSSTKTTCALGDLVLTTLQLQEMVELGWQENDRQWLEMEWVNALEEYHIRMKLVKVSWG
ncbi:hypothetical protein MIND_01096700 [Mycena indigotica]|uniref:Polymerase nucleotidyl transferase domain-containing protein n=1 Tax=Mycena indigotica TaxID=2126181 RepID=A0A8H6SAV0_9AGAR|nr:uncharacterized protein MIND_01096700 [Mycena indigotica]KAF7295567.1 hypothetical protein MIND_01096700 [Mycena indigotica]